MSKLRKAAQGKPCMVRIPSICNHDPETTVLAHIRRGGIAGIGQKPVDLAGVWACSACHDEIDGRTNKIIMADEIDEYILAGLCRTLDAVVKEGLVK